MSMNIELKPCPFCGGEAEMIDVNAAISVTKRTIYRVECKKGIECPGMPGTRGYDTEREAAAAWNTRAPQEETPDTWIIGREDGRLTYTHDTENCLTTVHIGFPYCPYCGKKMKR